MPQIVANSYTIMEKIIEILSTNDDESKGNLLFEYLATLETEKYLGFKSLFFELDEEKKKNYQDQKLKFTCSPLEEVMNFERNPYTYEETKYPPGFLFDWEAIFKKNSENMTKAAIENNIRVPLFGDNAPKRFSRKNSIRLSLIFATNKIKEKFSLTKKKFSMFMTAVKQKTIKKSIKGPVITEEQKEVKSDRILQNMIKATNPNLKKHEKLMKLMSKNKAFKKDATFKIHRKQSIATKLEAFEKPDIEEEFGDSPTIFEIKDSANIMQRVDRPQTKKNSESKTSRNMTLEETSKKEIVSIKESSSNKELSSSKESSSKGEREESEDLGSARKFI